MHYTPRPTPTPTHTPIKKIDIMVIFCINKHDQRGHNCVLITLISYLQNKFFSDRLSSFIIIFYWITHIWR